MPTTGQEQPMTGQEAMIGQEPSAWGGILDALVASAAGIATGLVEVEEAKTQQQQEDARNKLAEEKMKNDMAKDAYDRHVAREDKRDAIRAAEKLVKEKIEAAKLLRTHEMDLLKVTNESMEERLRIGNTGTFDVAKIGATETRHATDTTFAAALDRNATGLMIAIHETEGRKVVAEKQSDADIRVAQIGLDKAKLDGAVNDALEAAKAKKEKWKIAGELEIRMGKIETFKMFSQMSTYAMSINAIREAVDEEAKQGRHPSGFHDIALIFMFMKMMDPTSVVRESEYATVANTGSAGQRFIGLYNRMLFGAKLSSELSGQALIDAQKIQAGLRNQLFGVVDDMLLGKARELRPHLWGTSEVLDDNGEVTQHGTKGLYDQALTMGLGYPVGADKETIKNAHRNPVVPYMNMVMHIENKTSNEAGSVYFRQTMQAIKEKEPYKIAISSATEHFGKRNLYDPKVHTEIHQFFMLELGNTIAPSVDKLSKEQFAQVKAEGALLAAAMIHHATFVPGKSAIDLPSLRKYLPPDYMGEKVEGYTDPQPGQVTGQREATQ